jgi:hypothetical protein
MKSKNISKSKFISGIQCEKLLWFQFYRKDLAEEPDEQTQFIFDQGHLIGEMVQSLFQGGVLVEDDHEHIKEAIDTTRRMIDEGDMTLFEAAAEHGRYLARADVIKRVNANTNEWDMFEVKSGTHDDKEVYLQDLALQKLIFDGAGYPIRNAHLVVINNQYVRKGELEVDKLFKITDQTKTVVEIAKKYPPLMKRFLDVVDTDKEPMVSISKSRCTSPYECPFMNTCWKDVPEDSVFTLAHDRDQIANKAFAKGILKIGDIPEGTKLNPRQKRQVLAARTGQPFFNPKGIQSFLKALEYPLYFLDFETYNPLIPPYDGLRPYQMIPFQYSLHVLEKPDGELKHFEFLASGQEDPRPLFVESMLENIGTKGSVVVYSAFEQSRIKSLAEWLPKRALALGKLLPRIRDLSVPFRNQDIYYPDFLGSYSIKAVLPVLVPDMSYDDLEIGEGGAAALAYVKLTQSDLPRKEREQIRKALLVYCGQDTLAMVKLVEVLKSVR